MVVSFRIKKYKKGWIVEREVYKWHWFFGIQKKWLHVTSYSGLPDNPFYYRTPEGAREGALSQIKEEINYSFYFD